jgi:HEAT repeat protein
MQQRFGDAYRSYRRRAPFLVPLPSWLGNAFTAPSRWLFGKPLPERGGEIASVLAIFTLVLVGMSYVSLRVRDTPPLPADVQNASAEPSARAGLLIEALRQADTWHARRPYFDALREMAADAVGQLVELLDDPSPELREMAAQLLGHSGSPEAIEPLIRHLAEPESSVRFWVISALGELRADQAVEPLLLVLEGGRDEGSCANAAVTALGAIGAAEAVDVLIARLDEPKPWARANVVTALGSIGSRRAVGPLLELLNGEPQDVHVRRALMVAFAQLQAPEAEAALRRALDDPDREVRIYAAEALRALTD